MALVTGGILSQMVLKPGLEALDEPPLGPLELPLPKVCTFLGAILSRNYLYLGQMQECVHNFLDRFNVIYWNKVT